ncbi:hypothetical protein AVEN_225666-1 [Araneus ventricosus]|uniref:Uncharacterized protein n=1 Tax=Araneus ventricosus TaxID=182803 RepID=A0A4Y2R8G3_ARAVE|nr:hypothetical protein AVEN_225666-1 [Araneus ventricosus]
MKPPPARDTGRKHVARSLCSTHKAPTSTRHREETRGTESLLYPLGSLTVKSRAFTPPTEPEEIAYLAVRWARQMDEKWTDRDSTSRPAQPVISMEENSELSAKFSQLFFY